MRFRNVFLLGAVIGIPGGGLGCMAHVGDGDATDNPQEAASDLLVGDDFGTLRIISTNASNTKFSTQVDQNNPFFKNLGANGRTCNSCHKLENALGISVAEIQRSSTRRAAWIPSSASTTDPTLPRAFSPIPPRLRRGARRSACC